MKNMEFSNQILMQKLSFVFVKFLKILEAMLTVLGFYNTSVNSQVYLEEHHGFNGIHVSISPDPEMTKINICWSMILHTMMNFQSSSHIISV